MNCWQPGRAFIPHILELQSVPGSGNTPGRGAVPVLRQPARCLSEHSAHCERGALSGGWYTWDMSGWYPTCRFIQSGYPHVSSPFKYCKQTLVVVHSGLYALALHVKEIVGAQISPGCCFCPALCRLEDHLSNFHTLLGSFSKSWFSNL